MRIVHLCSSLAGGGAERQLCYLASELGARGHRVDVVVVNSGQNLALLAAAENVRIHILGEGKPVHHGKRSWANYNPGILGRVIALLRRLRPDVVQTWIMQMDVIGGIAAAMSQVPWVLREPVSALMYSSGGLRVAVRTLLARTAAAVVANSAAGSEYWQAVQPSAPRVVIRNGVPLKEIDRVSRLSSSEITNEMPLILYAGRFHDQKNVERTLKAIVQAASQCEGQGILCGAGPLRSRLAEMLEQLPGSSRVKLWDYQTQLWPLMKRADVFLSASHYEGCPNAVMEAMACRCPLVVSNIQEHHELLSADSAEFVDHQSVDSISQGILRVLENRKLSEARVATAYSRIRHFSVEEMTGRYEDLYKAVCRNTQ